MHLDNSSIFNTISNFDYELLAVISHACGMARFAMNF